MIALLSKRSLILATGLAIAQLTIACGDDANKDDDKKEDTPDKETDTDCAKGTISCPGYGWVTKASGASAVIDFKDADKDAEFIVMPFATGEIATIEGGSDSALFDVSLAPEATSGAGLYFSTPKSQTFAQPAYDWQALDADRRFLANRFRRNLGEQQVPGFWETVRRVDRATGASLTDQGPGRLETYFRNSIRTARSQPTHFANKTGVTCPLAGGSIAVPGASNADPEDVTVKAGSDEQDFCYVVVSDPVTEPKAEAIKNTVKTVLARFKSANFYNDAFPPIGDLTFKPYVVIVDFTDKTVWPNEALKGAGFYVAELVEDVGAPVLYMASNFESVEPTQKNSDPATKNIWHVTIAHEMQHAIIDYYRGKSDKKAENAFIDEGIAHLYEDIFGYGQERFSFPKGFLTLFSDGIYSFLHAANSSNEERGASQALLYYLTSKKGGFTKDENGIINSGEGLKFLINIVKNATQSGALNLSTTFGGDWVETMGNYLGALVLDGTKLEKIDDKYKVQEPITGVSDLTGSTDKTFGMHYNGFRDLADRSTAYEAFGTTPLKLEGQTYYQTKPIKVTLTGKGQKVKVTWSGEQTGAAVSVVRIK